MIPSGDRSSFLADLTTLLNRYSKENGSNTPDWILAEAVMYFLTVFDLAVNAREVWYGREKKLDSARRVEVT
jgi:hypothetical protein